MPTKLNLIGERYGRLIVIEKAPNKGKRTQWKCLCDCRKEKVVSTDCLRNGNTKSCGCYKSELVTQKNKDRNGKNQGTEDVFFLINRKIGRGFSCLAVYSGIGNPVPLSVGYKPYGKKGKVCMSVGGVKLFEQRA